MVKALLSFRNGCSFPTTILLVMLIVFQVYVEDTKDIHFVLKEEHEVLLEHLVGAFVYSLYIHRKRITNFSSPKVKEAEQAKLPLFSKFASTSLAWNLRWENSSCILCICPNQLKRLTIVASSTLWNVKPISNIIFPLIHTPTLYIDVAETL